MRSATSAPGVRCYIIGAGPDRKMLDDVSAEHQLEDTVTFIPACMGPQVALWMSAADVVTLPSYKEGCPNVVIEGLASGRPIVATSVGGIPELVNDSCGRLIEPKDIPGLAQALTNVLSRSWDADAISAQQSRSWQDVADQVYSILQLSIERRRT